MLITFKAGKEYCEYISKHSTCRQAALVCFQSRSYISRIIITSLVFIKTADPKNEVVCLKKKKEKKKEQEVYSRVLNK